MIAARCKAHRRRREVQRELIFTRTVSGQDDPPTESGLQQLLPSGPSRVQIQDCSWTLQGTAKATSRAPPPCTFVSGVLADEYFTG